MFKKLVAVLLSLFMLAAALPVSVSASSNEGQLLCQSITDHYAKILEENETDSLSGWCGVLASYQLYFLGVNSWPRMANGNDQYDLYLNSSYTDTGYRIKRYPAEEYTLEEALNAITHGGIRNAYNILIGFHSTTTEAGAQFGHAVVIYGIVDGKVYFTESFGTAFSEKEGYPAVCTISQFAAMYDSWTVFEGAVVFGRKGYLDSCLRSDANMYVQVQRADPLYSQPCVPDTDEVESLAIRTAQKGEYLLVTGMYLNSLGRYYYQVVEGENVYYLDAQRAIPVQLNTDDVIVEALEMPSVLAVGADFELKGKISSQNSLISGITLCVTDSGGRTVLTHSGVKKSGTYDLSRDIYNSMIDFGTLAEGLYTLTLTADVLSTYLEDGVVVTATEQATMYSAPLAVGENNQMPRQGRVAPEFISDGWIRADGKWCCYEAGTPRTGWLNQDGIDYYLAEDGTATTGWAEVDGKTYYFSAAGAKCTGWLRTQEAVWYLLEDGQMATGWQKLDGKLYYFGEDGILQTDGWKEIDGKTYYLFEDGAAATGWLTLPRKGVYFFHREDGHLLVEAIGMGENTTYKTYTVDGVSVPSIKDKT